MSLIPRMEGQLLSYEEWSKNTPATGYELWDGIPFTSENTIERDKLLIALLYSSGIEHFLSLLPKESIKLLEEKVAEQIAQNLVDTLAVPLIAEKTGVSLEKVYEFRREYEESLYGKNAGDLLQKAEVKSGKAIPTRGTTHLKGDTKIQKINNEALKRIRAFKESGNWD